ncbi:hypothetical protein ACFPRL_31620 [Pseudoclavibacter helvolus]
MREPRRRPADSDDEGRTQRAQHNRQQCEPGEGELRREDGDGLAGDIWDVDGDGAEMSKNEGC